MSLNTGLMSIGNGLYGAVGWVVILPSVAVFMTAFRVASDLPQKRHQLCSMTGWNLTRSTTSAYSPPTVVRILTEQINNNVVELYLYRRHTNAIRATPGVLEGQCVLGLKEIQMRYMRTKTSTHLTNCINFIWSND